MYRSGHVRILFAIAAIILLAAGQIAARTSDLLFAKPTLLSQSQNTSQTANTGASIRLRWDARPGVFRYRLQLARDATFADIVLDRVVNGNTNEITGLLPGRYFWRVAALTTKLDRFSLPSTSAWANVC